MVSTLKTTEWLEEFDVMTIGDLTEIPTAIKHTKHCTAVIEVGDVRWRQLPCRDNEPVWWEAVKRYSIGIITLRRGMMFLNPDGRAIDYLNETRVSVRVWRNTSTDTTRLWEQGTVFDLGGAAGLHCP